MIKSEQVKILTITFLAGACVMVMEIAASRLLAPYFGTSLFVWTNIIGVVLGALSLGYWVGGKWADRGSSIIHVGLLLAVSGLWTLLTPFLVKLFTNNVAQHLFTGNITSILPVFTVSCLVFALPIGLLGAVNPILVKRLVEANNHVGQSSGGVGAWSTVGSIVGTFTAGLYLIPSRGTRQTLLISAWLLVILASVLLFKNKKMIAVILAIAILLSWFYSYSLKTKAISGLLYEGDTPYHFVRVFEDMSGRRSMLFNAGIGVQTLYQPGGGQLGLGYYDKLSKLPDILGAKKGKIKILMIGLAGGEILHQMHAQYSSQVELETAEIDPKVVELARKYFDLGKLPVKVRTEDARTFLSRNAKIKERRGRYDIIIVDAYQNELYLPWQLTTKEFWQIVDQNLNKDGIMAANLLAGLTSSPLLAAIQNTTASVFENVMVGQSGSANYFLIASQDKFLNKKVRSVPEFTDSNSVKFNAGIITLTDDRAPIEQLAHRALKEMWGGR